MKFAPEHIKEILLTIPQSNFNVVKLTEEAEKLSSYYLNAKIVGESSFADTQHIAIATIQQVVLLVSWNFKHIVNYNKIRLYNSINLKYGYKILEIRSPRDITNEK
ncbi:MAG: hypothetical protein EPN82_10850 [Bacteroidetes bacterium]|nr:MAG: hypothetical protein EPN82_10850 [Bacteroidota bacterium]